MSFFGDGVFSLQQNSDHDRDLKEDEEGTPTSASFKPLTVELISVLSPKV